MALYANVFDLDNAVKNDLAAELTTRLSDAAYTYLGKYQPTVYQGNLPLNEIGGDVVLIGATTYLNNWSDQKQGVQRMEADMSLQISFSATRPDLPEVSRQACVDMAGELANYLENNVQLSFDKSSTVRCYLDSRGADICTVKIGDRNWQTAIDCYVRIQGKTGSFS